MEHAQINEVQKPNPNFKAVQSLIKLDLAVLESKKSIQS